MERNLTLVFEPASPAEEARLQRALGTELDLVRPGTRRALEIGCADGRLTRLLGERAGFAVGIDVSIEQLRKATVAGAPGRSGVAFVVADLRHPPFADGTFDFVVSRFALHHTDLEQSLPAVRNLVRPGGRLVLRDVFALFPRLHRYRWYHVGSIAMKLAREGAANGWRAALRLRRHLVSPASMDHVMRVNRHVTLRRYRALHRRWLPGCALVAGTTSRLFGIAPLVVWDSPEEKRAM